jgi:hypothetical protein
MIRQICLSCYKMSELPDDAAGTRVDCPNCGKPIEVPAKYTPDVAAGGGVAPPVDTYPVLPVTDRPAPPAGAKPVSSIPSSDPSAPPLPPMPAPPPGVAVPPPPPPPPGEYARSCWLPVKPAWLAWVPLGCLAAAFILSFFTWAKLAPGGYSVVTQNGWDALAGDHGGSPPETKEWTDLTKAFDSKEAPGPRLRTDLFALLYLLLLLPTLALAVVERVLKDPKTQQLPGPLMWLPQVWPYLLLLIGGLSLLLLILLGLASLRGFGIERAVQDVAAAKYEKELAVNTSGPDLRKTNILVGQEVGRFAPKQTVWLNLLLLLHVLAVVALLARIWLTTRGDKPAPRVGVQW